MIKFFIHYFDKLEDRIRVRLSRYPIIYTIIGGISIVLFWRGVWLTADQVSALLPQEFVWIDGPLSVVVSMLVLLATGLFVSFFVADAVILSGVKQEKKLVEKTEQEIESEEKELKNIKHVVDDIDKEIRKLERNKN